MAFPLTFNFISEFLILIGAATISFWLVFLFLFVMLFSTIFCMWTFSRVCFGMLTFGHSFFLDLTFREFSVLITLLSLILFFGIQPVYILNTSYSIFTLYLNFFYFI
jgi:NADH:ubiquinone oxidoreductase subunit 4 (subunit M)